MLKSYYLYGLCSQPSQKSDDSAAALKLYRKVIGSIPGIAMGASLHPYQLVNLKGTTVWQAAYVLHHESFKDDATIFTPRPAGFDELHMWPDTRLSTDKHPIFARYVPFVIPFLASPSSKTLEWDLQIEQEMKLKGNASDFVESVTQAIRFLMPPPGFVLGFDEFDETKPEKLIDRFVNFIQAQGLE